ncbi:MAG: tRNA (guanine-N7)-methyltransferase [Chlorobiaceae bacterium]|jgi:tRNA (guanine-N7-)-methyltransferase|nr:tRNA (guanine-N7)-methyltransferase [Chlorobiaceae bacterium]
MDNTSPLCVNHAVTTDQKKNFYDNLIATGTIEVEIGFGDGDYLISRARTYPERTFFGIEHKPSLIAGVSKKAASLNVDNIRFFQSCAKDAFNDLFTSCSISRVYALFPDPWPKRKHIKYRLFSSSYLRLLNNRLVPEGEALIVTDSSDYGRWIVKQTPDTGFEVECSMVPPQFNTRFERKWIVQGYHDFFQILLKKRDHIET